MSSKGKLSFSTASRDTTQAPSGARYSGSKPNCSPWNPPGASLLGGGSGRRHSQPTSPVSIAGT
jgi:hypothetical protein